MKINKLKGPNSIPTQILEISNQITCKTLTYLINLPFSNGIFPDLLKASNVIPISKRGKNQDYNNHRPISLISNLRKLMEKIVHPRLYSFLDKTLSFLSSNMVFGSNYPLMMLLLIQLVKSKLPVTKVSLVVVYMLISKKAYVTVNHELIN